MMDADDSVKNTNKNKAKSRWKYLQTAAAATTTTTAAAADARVRAHTQTNSNLQQHARTDSARERGAVGPGSRSVRFARYLVRWIDGALGTVFSGY
jgi:hypothetical protein